MKIAFVIPGTDISGGVYVILQHASYLASHGHHVVLLTQESVDADSLDWHPDASDLQLSTIDRVADDVFDVAIATLWVTVYWLSKIQSQSYAYFNQSVESLFYRDDQMFERSLAEATYLSGASIITEATWVQQYVKDRYGLDAHLVRNGIRKDVYRCDGPAIQEREKGMLRVLIEGPLGSPFKNVARTIELCRRSKADEVWLLTSSEVEETLDVDRVFSRVPVADTPAIYRSCDVLVKLSYIEGMFGPPLEMFHCGGTAVVYDVSGHDEYIVNQENAIVIPSRDEEAVVEAVNGLKADGEELNRLKKGALATASRWGGWSDSSEIFESAVQQIMSKSTDSTANASRNSVALLSNVYDSYWSSCKNLEQAQVDCSNSINRLNDMEAMLKERQTQLDTLVGSLSWKVGRFMTWLPRRVLGILSGKDI